MQGLDSNAADLMDAHGGRSTGLLDLPADEARDQGSKGAADGCNPGAWVHKTAEERPETAAAPMQEQELPIQRSPRLLWRAHDISLRSTHQAPVANAERPSQIRNEKRRSDRRSVHRLGIMNEKTAAVALAALAQEARLRVFRALVGAGPEGMTPG